MYGNTCGVVGLSCIPVEDRKLGEELSPAIALRSPATRRGTCTCVFANRENVGRVDHPEHHAQVTPRVERRLKTNRTIGCHGEQKGKKLPAVFDCRIFRRKGRCTQPALTMKAPSRYLGREPTATANRALDSYRFRCWFGKHSNLKPDRYEREDIDQLR